MNFNENLKEAMFCKNMTSKQLSALTEIKVDTINSYLKTNGSLPMVDKAVKIAKVLEVSINFLVNGFEETENDDSMQQIQFTPEVRKIAEEIKTFNKEDLNAILTVAKALKKKYDD